MFTTALRDQNIQLIYIYIKREVTVDVIRRLVLLVIIQKPDGTERIHTNILLGPAHPWARVLINPRRACAARVIVLGLCVCVCVCVSALICRLTHWNHKREIPTDSSQYGNDFKKVIFVKMFCSKVMA